MVMTIHKLTAGDGYTYLTRHVAGGDVGRERGQDAADYYTAEGNPPGQWIGRGAHLLGLGGHVTEAQMKALFGLGMHPDADRIIEEFLGRNTRAGMTAEQASELRAAAMLEATLGRPFPQYEALEPFEERVTERAHAVREQIGREPNEAEIKKIRREEARKQRAAVAGYDVVFSPVKSAALLWALDDRDWVRDAVLAAHNEAKDSALAMLEDHAAFTRTGTGGIAQIATHGLIAASFDHYDSRAGDPNLHTHVAISNKVCGIDGKWRSLDGRALYRIVVAASEHYNTAFEVALTARLGVRFSSPPPTARGKEPVREIEGIPARLIRYFSQRRSDIEARYDELLRQYRTDHGHEPSLAASHQLARQANLETRSGKKSARSLTSMRAGWKQQVLNAFDTNILDDLQHTVGRVRPETQEIDIAAIAEQVTMSVAGQRSTWTMWNLRAEAERVLRFQHRFDSIESHTRTAEAIVAKALAEHCLSVEAPSMTTEPSSLRRADGASVFTEHGAKRYTSSHVLDAEQRLLAAARSLTGSALPVAGTRAALSSFDTMLDEHQRELVVTFASNPAQLAVGIGPAGSGKTTAMRAFQQVLEMNGRRLIALATSSAAAKILESELNTPADNLHKFLYNLTALGPDKAMAGTVRAGDVILVDEAGMAGTFNLDKLVSFAQQRGALVRLLGDPQQLAAVESGGAMRLIASDIGATELASLHRFNDSDEAAATLLLRQGDSEGLGFYEAHDRIRGGSQQAMAEAAYAGWLADMRAGKLTLMTAATNHTVSALSARARAERVSSGLVEPKGMRLHDGNIAGTGDWIVTRQNNRTLSANGGRDFVKNGDGWQVIEQYGDGRLLVQHLTHRGRIVLPAAYVATQVELLYAVTTNRAQGSTVDTAHAIISDEMARENLYVATTRARSSTTLYVITHELLPLDEDQRLDRVRYDALAVAAHEVLESVLGREQAEKSATETIRDNQIRAESLATLVPRLRHGLEKANLPDGESQRRLLPWVAIPPAFDQSTMGRYLAAVSEQIRRRTDELVDQAATTRPSWTSVFGDEPSHAAHRAKWLDGLRTVAAFREQYKVADDNSDRPLGPYIAEGHAGHRAYWHAAAAVIGLNLTDTDPQQNSATTAIFRGLPPEERTTITAELAERLGPLWFGQNDHDASRGLYGKQLAELMRARGHLKVSQPSKWRITDPRLERIRAAREAERDAYRKRLAEGLSPRARRATPRTNQPRHTSTHTHDPARPQQPRAAAEPSLDAHDGIRRTGP